MTIDDLAKPTADGRVEVDPAALETALFAQLGESEPEVEEYDPVKDGQERAARNRPQPDSELAKLARR
jgi:hypothetical protein